MATSFASSLLRCGRRPVDPSPHADAAAESPAQDCVTQGRRHSPRRKITTPRATRYESPLAAWTPTRPRRPAPLVMSVSALATRCPRASPGDETRLAYLGRATQLANRTAPVGTEALRGCMTRPRILRRRMTTRRKQTLSQRRRATASLANEFCRRPALPTRCARAPTRSRTELDRRCRSPANAGTGATSCTPYPADTRALPPRRTPSPVPREALVAAIVKPRDWKARGSNRPMRNPWSASPTKTQRPIPLAARTASACACRAAANCNRFPPRRRRPQRGACLRDGSIAAPAGGSASAHNRTFARVRRRGACASCAIDLPAPHPDG